MILQYITEQTINHLSKKERSRVVFKWKHESLASHKWRLEIETEKACNSSLTQTTLLVSDEQILQHKQLSRSK